MINKFHISFLFLVVLLSGWQMLPAQDPPFIHFDEDNGLPSIQVYGLALTKNNVLWANTDRGVVSYDGYNIVTYTQSEGLIDNCILRLFPDLDDGIWLSSLVNSVNKIENSTVITPNLNQWILDKPAHEHLVQQMFFHENGNRFINFNSPGLYQFTDDTLFQVKEHLKNAEDFSFYIHYKSPTEYYWDQIQRSPEIKFSDENKTRIDSSEFYIKTFSNVRNDHFRKCLIPIGPKEFIFSYVEWLFHFKDGKLINRTRMPEEILSGMYDKDRDELWIGIHKYGVWRYSHHDLKSHPSKYLQGTSVSSIILDHENSYWFATTHDGIYQTNSMFVQNFLPSKKTNGGPEDNIIRSLAVLNETLFMGTHSGKVFIKEIKSSSDNGPFDRELKLPDTEGQVRRIIPASSGFLSIFKDQFIEIFPNGQFTGRKIWDAYAYDLLELNNQHQIVSFTHSIIEQYQGQEHHRYTEDLYFQRVRDMLLDSDSTLWLSSQTYGVFEWPKDQAQPQSCIKIDNLFKNRALDLAETGDLIWFSISGRGLLALSKSDRVTYQVTKNMHRLSSDIVDVLFVENDSVLWAGGNNGLDRITISRDTIYHFNVHNFTTKLGLPSNKIHAIAQLNHDIWVGTNKGLVRLIPEILHPQDRTKLSAELISAKSDTLDLDLSEPADLASGSHDLEFNFRAVSYQFPHEVFYQYRLLPIEPHWIAGEDRQVRFAELGYGDYEFQVRASYDGDFLESEPSSYSFTIRKRFAETTLHLVIMILGTAGILLWIVLLIIKGLRTREKIKQRLLLAEKKALLAQMNPHFIFNSLNSIQHYIIQQDEENANLYLSKFSSLIRRILDNSKKRTISLAEEIDTILLYLNLEKLRFEEKFDYSINKSDQLDQNEVMIPPMLIQPFVENAIWHGLTPLDEGGFLKISFTRQGDRMKVIIEDNGIGRTRAGQTNRPFGHSSTGIQNISERLSLLNKMSRNHIYSQILDLKTADGNSCGTRVELSVPLDLELKHHE